MTNSEFQILEMLMYGVDWLEIISYSIPTNHVYYASCMLDTFMLRKYFVALLISQLYKISY